MGKKSGLGRGLGDILEEIGSTYESSFNEVLEESESEIISDVEIDLIEPNPYQPRKHFDEEKLKELSDSIKRHGLLQPIVVVANNDRYILVAGERRLRASKIANLKTIKAIIAPIELDEIKLRELALIENIQREDLNPIELANSYKELIEVHNITHEELSKIVNKSRSQITNTLRLLNLDESVQEQLAKGEISQGHAKVLVKLPKSEQKRIAQKIIDDKLSVREIERLIKSKDKKGKGISKSDFRLSKEDAKLLQELLPFEIKTKSQSVEILLHSKEDLAKFIEFIKKS
ncbi:MAG: ParB/RepB/Spo0J family partition protein [Epsilonproteobacteria bacterium]|nr:ParB/RepB/Spo0J family partition protein [Campylobacterota bacterium]